MGNYRFKDIIDYFGQKLKATPPQEDVERGEVDLLLDEGAIVTLSQGLYEGSFQLVMDVGVFLNDPKEEQLNELASANFLGVNTGGCALCLDATGTLLSLKACTTPGTSPQENWEWLHRLVAVAHEWAKKASAWEAFTPLVRIQEEPQKPGSIGGPLFKA